jgi:hypothetical protein
LIVRLKVNNDINKLKTKAVSAAAEENIIRVIIKHFISKFIKPININKKLIPK